MSTQFPRLSPVGDSALLVELENRIDPAVSARVHALAAALASLHMHGLGEAVPAYRSLLLHYDPLRLAYADVAAIAGDVIQRATSVPPSQPRLVEIPTCYEEEFGPDLAAVAARAGLTRDEAVRLHSEALYPVYMLGFTPGFPYMGGLPPVLATTRLPTPRTSVPAGSVGIAGEQTGIYPISSPGGWQLVGRTPLLLFDPHRDPPALLAPGDRVRFVPISSGEFERLHEQHRAEPEPAPRPQPGAHAAFEVLEAGPLTTVQDLGRYGYQSLGVPVAGAMDALAHTVANRLVGNDDGAAALEVTAGGLILRARSECLIAVGGGDLGLRVNGWPIPLWTSAFVRRGWIVELTRRRSGFRASLALAGGIAVPAVLGSRSTYLQGGFGGLSGRALRKGDVLYAYDVQFHLSERAGRSAAPPAAYPADGESLQVDVVLGPQQDAFTDEGIATFLSGEYTVSRTSSRMGYRLEGPPVEHCGPADILTDGIVMGAIQVPADRRPILMMADRQTAGGYPKIAVAARADLPFLAQLAPGERVRFRAVTVEEAQRRYREMMRATDSVPNTTHRT